MSNTSDSPFADPGCLVGMAFLELLHMFIAAVWNPWGLQWATWALWLGWGFPVVLLIAAALVPGPRGGKGS